MCLCVRVLTRVAQIVTFVILHAQNYTNNNNNLRLFQLRQNAQPSQSVTQDSDYLHVASAYAATQYSHNQA